MPLLYDEILMNEDGGFNSVSEAINYIESREYKWNSTVNYDAGLYATVDQTGKNSYFFVGAVEDNYVYFAGYYWRIVRIDGDGNIKMIYSGETIDAYEENLEISKSAFNSADILLSDGNAINESTEGVGYVYEENVLRGSSNDSTIKQVVDAWYKEKIKDTIYENSVETTLYCIDRTSYNSSTGLELYDIIETDHEYAAYHRLDLFNEGPSIACNSNTNDELSLSVGLISVDEVTFASAVLSNTFKYSKNYLITGSFYWTLSPSGFCKNNTYMSLVYHIDSSGSAYHGYIFKTTVGSSLGVRPTISLKATTISKSGNGSISDPYVIS